MKRLLAILLVSSNCYADVCATPVKINAGQAAPCNGYVFSDANEQTVRTQLTFKDLQIDNLTKRNAVQEDMLNIDAQQMMLYKSELKDEKTLTEWQKMLYFGLGVVVTGLVSYGVVKAAGR